MGDFHKSSASTPNLKPNYETTLHSFRQQLTQNLHNQSEKEAKINKQKKKKKSIFVIKDVQKQHDLLSNYKHPSIFAPPPKFEKLESQKTHDLS